jgi:hypothetical protein
MPRGGKRKNAGRPPILSWDDKFNCYAMVNELIRLHFETRHDRAYGKMARKSHRAGDPIPELEELRDHFTDIRRPSPEEWKQMTPDERVEVVANRGDYLAQHMAAPDGTAIGEMHQKRSNYTRRKLSRLVTVLPPTKNELGQMYREVAEVMTARLGRPISARQVGEARRHVVKDLGGDKQV